MHYDISFSTPPPKSPIIGLKRKKPDKGSRDWASKPWTDLSQNLKLVTIEIILKIK